jgi:hypothetical protein
VCKKQRKHRIRIASFHASALQFSLSNFKIPSLHQKEWLGQNSFNFQVWIVIWLHRRNRIVEFSYAHPKRRRFVDDCDIKPETGSMLKLKAVARQIHARHQTLLSIASREEPLRMRLQWTSVYESRRGTRLEYFKDRKHKHQLGSFQVLTYALCRKALTCSLRTSSSTQIVMIFPTAPRRPDNLHFAEQRLDSGHWRFVSHHLPRI